MKKFTLIFPARTKKYALSTIVSFVILVFTINCAMNLGANASFELPNNDPSKNTSSQSPEERTLRKDINLIDLVDCLYGDYRSSPFFRLIERLLDFRTNNPFARSVYERTLNFFVKKKSATQNPRDLEELNRIKQSTLDEFNRLKEEAQNYSGNASEGSSDYGEEVFISILGHDLFGEPLPHQEDAPPRPETSNSDRELSQHQEDAPPRPEITLPEEEPPRPLLPEIEANDYTQPEPGSSDSDECFDADGYFRPLTNMPAIPPPHYSLFLGK